MSASQTGLISMQPERLVQIYHINIVLNVSRFEVINWKLAHLSEFIVETLGKKW